MKAIGYRVKYLFDAAYACITTPDSKINWIDQKVEDKPLATWISDHSSLGKLDFKVAEKDHDAFVDIWSSLMATLSSSKVCAFVRFCFSSALIFGFFLPFGF